MPRNHYYILIITALSLYAIKTTYIPLKAKQNIPIHTIQPKQFLIPHDAQTLYVSSSILTVKPTLFKEEKKESPIPYSTFNTLTHDKDNFITINNSRYYLYQFHFHVPSDHILFGKRSDAELHIIYRNDAENLAVLGILFSVDSFTTSKSKKLFFNKKSYFATVLEILKNLVNTSSKKINTYSISTFLPSNKEAFTFIGTTTMDPVITNVRWILFKGIVSITQKELNQLLALRIAARTYPLPMEHEIEHTKN
jgi:carbonic anhydrase